MYCLEFLSSQFKLKFGFSHSINFPLIIITFPASAFLIIDMILPHLLQISYLYEFILTHLYQALELSSLLYQIYCFFKSKLFTIF